MLLPELCALLGVLGLNFYNVLRKILDGGNWHPVHIHSRYMVPTCQASHGSGDSSLPGRTFSDSLMPSLRGYFL